MINIYANVMMNLVYCVQTKIYNENEINLTYFLSSTPIYGVFYVAFLQKKAS